MQPYHTLKGSGSILLSLFEVCGMPGCNSITLRRGRGHFYLVFLRFVECHDATLSHFEGVWINLLGLFEVPKASFFRSYAGGVVYASEARYGWRGGSS